jgi:pilus assembly protein CpaB
MRLLFGLVLIVGIGLAGFAAYLAKNRIGEYQATLAEQQAKLASNVPLEPVFVLNRRVSYGEQITKKDVRIVAWPENAIPNGAFQEGPVLFPETGELRTALRVMEKDEALMAMKVTEPGEDAGVSSRLAKGMRAFALRVDVSTGVSGFLRPGDLVDVYWTGKAKGRQMTTLIQTNLQLLAVDQIADGDRNAPTIARTVTVMASPERVAALAQAQSTGRLTLSLVGAGDDTELASIEVGQNELLGIEQQVIVEQEAEKVCTVRTRRGQEVVTIPVQCPE